MRDERPLRLLRKADLPSADVQRLVDLAEAADHLAQEAGKDLQFEFGKQHVGFIVGCNQFLRIYRSGEDVGVVEMWRPPEGLAWKDAVGGQVFRMFGWRSIDALAADDEALHRALKAVFAAAASTAPTALFG